MMLSHDIGVDTQSLPTAMIQPAPVVPTGAHSKILSKFIFVDDRGTGAPSAVYIVAVAQSLFSDKNKASISDQLHDIKEKLGLNLSQLSKILDASRPQLYKWLEGSVIPQREDFNQKISVIYSMLDVVPYEHSKYFGKLAKRYVSDQTTVFDVLADNELDKEKLLAVYDSIKGDIEIIANRKIKEQQKNHSSDDSEVVLLPE
ncbi:MAG: hypothetical protein QM484_01975 [Woeseiaceae bacterium]